MKRLVIAALALVAVATPAVVDAWGNTGHRLIGIAAEEGIAVVEEAFSVEAAKAAREAFVTSATSFLTPVVQIDDRVIADGAPGPLSRRLQGWYLDYCAGLRARA